MLNVESIQNGIVIDHITAGKGLEIYKFLDLENISRPIALLQYVKSEKYGKKDLIKIEEPICFRSLTFSAILTIR